LDALGLHRLHSREQLVESDGEIAYTEKVAADALFD